MMIVVLTLGVLFNRISWVDIINLSGIDVYTALLFLFLLGQFVLLLFIDYKSKEIRNVNAVIRSSRTAIWISQILLSLLIITLLIEIIFVSKYHTILLTAISSIAYCISIVFTGTLTYMFFSWFRRQKNAITIVYGISSLIIVMGLVITLLLTVTVLSSRPNEVRQYLVGSGIFVRQDSFVAILDNSYQFFSIAMFLAMWCATTVLLHHYSIRLGRAKFWIIIALPLVYFLSQFISNILNISMILVAEPVLIGIILSSIFTISLVVGGVLFGVAFTRLSSKFHKSDTIRNYLIIAGYGFMFLLISNNGVLLATVPYPPYAVQSVSFLGVASYSILLGIYSSALVASADVELRKSIRKFAFGEGNLLDSIGTAEVQRIIEDKASQMLKESQKYMEEEIGFTSLTKEEVARQVEVVIKEIEEAKLRRDRYRS